MARDSGYGPQPEHILALVTVGKWPWWEMFGAIGHYRSQMPEVKSFESA